MANSRRSFTREFKIQVVRLVTVQNYSFAEAARQLGISETMLRLWEELKDPIRIISDES